MTLIVHSFLKNPLKNNNYAVIDDVSNEAVLVDCSSPDDEIVRWVKKQGAQIKYILLTHAHFDHVLGVNSHHDKFGLDAYLYEKDLPLLAKLNEYTRFLGMKDSDIPQVHSFDFLPPYVYCL